jgi:hypothetical protein
MKIQRQDKADEIVFIRIHLADLGFDPKLLAGIESISTIDDLPAPHEDGLELAIDPDVFHKTRKGRFVHGREDLDGRM